MIPPSFGDLGSRAASVVDEEFRHGFLHFRLKTRSDSGVDFDSKGAANVDSGAVNAETQLRFSVPEYGLSFKEKWIAVKRASDASSSGATDASLSGATDASSPKYAEDTLKSDICAKNLLCQGSKFTFESSFAPASMTRREKVKGVLKGDSYHLSGEFRFPGGDSAAAATCGLVLGLGGGGIGGGGGGGFLLGYRSPLSLRRWPSLGEIAVGFLSEDVEVATKVSEGGGRLTASLCHRVSDRLSTAFVTSWSRPDNRTSFVLGAEYKLDDDARVKVKVDQNSLVGLAYSQTLRNGVRLSACASIDGKKIPECGHQVGFGLLFDLS